MIRSSLVVLSAWWLCACQTPKSLALDRAEAAALRQDRPEEARALSRACALDAKDEALCARARAAREGVLQAELPFLTRTCELGLVDKCEAGGARLSGLGEDEALRTLLASSRAALWNGCLKLPLQTPVDALARVRCAEQYRATSAPNPEFDRDAAALRRELARWLSGWSAQHGARAPAESMAASSLAQCLGGASPSPDDAAQWDRLLATWRRRVSLSVSLPDGRTRSLCPVLSPLLPQGWTCTTEEGGKVDHRLALRVEWREVPHEVRETVREARYVSGVERHANPAYRELRTEVRERDAQLEDLRTAYELANADCRASGHFRPCARADALRRRYNDLVGDRNNVNWASRTQPSVVEHAVYDTFRYSELEHTWSRSVRVSGGAGILLEDRLWVQGVERPGFEPAGLTAAVARAPEEADWLEPLEGLLSRAVDGVARELGTKARTDALAGCPAQDALECRVRERFLRVRDIRTAGMDALSSAVAALHPELPKVSCSRPWQR